MESQLSKNLMYLNQEYINLKYSSIYQRALNFHKILYNLKKGGLSYIYHFFKWRVKKTNVNFDIKETIEPSVGTNLNAKIVVYTCITGNYDSIKEPLYVNNNIDYYVITDMEVPDNSSWKKIDINKYDELKNLSLPDKNRYIKFFPHKLFPNYDFSIYVDGVIQIVADLQPLVENMGSCVLGLHRHNARNCLYDEAKAIIYANKAPKELVLNQINKYKKEQFPVQNGLYENTILIRKNNDENCIRLMESWWVEYMNSCKRDQLSLPYVIWKEKFNQKSIYIIGNDLDRNPRFKRNFRHVKR